MILKNKHKNRCISVGGDATYDFCRNIDVSVTDTSQSGTNQIKLAKRAEKTKQCIEEIIQHGKIIVLQDHHHSDVEMILDKCIQCGRLVNDRRESNERSECDRNDRRKLREGAIGDQSELREPLAPKGDHDDQSECDSSIFLKLNDKCLCMICVQEYEKSNDNLK